jgi:patatin-like phospholipase/acyl hydrolase
MSDIIDFYFSFGEKAFKNTTLYNIKTFYGLIGPKFSDLNINEILLSKFNHYKLKDLLKPCMFTGYDIEKRKPIFFTNKDTQEKYVDYNIKDIVRGSIAIPSFFSPASFQYGVDSNTIIDGGIFANNPSLAAYIEVSKTMFNGQTEIDKRFPADLLIISLGTGIPNQKSYPYKIAKNWGKTEWIVPILDMMMTSNAEITDYEMQRIFYEYKQNYKRINPLIKLESSDILDTSKENITKLLKDTNQYIQENKEVLNTLAKEICDINFLF